MKRVVITLATSSMATLFTVTLLYAVTHKLIDDGSASVFIGIIIAVACAISFFQGEKSNG